jgi:hypothetical protein
MATEKTFKEYLEHFQGTASRMQTIFNYHYDQIQRELEQELKEDKDYMEFIIEYMEESMNWPSCDDLEQFIKDLN